MRNEKRLLRARGICVIIPTFNNEKTIGEVVKETLCFCDDVIVVNDGCTDSTAQIIGEIDNIIVVAYSQTEVRATLSNKVSEKPCPWDLPTPLH